MGRIITPHDGTPVTAATLDQATQPLRTYEVQCVVAVVQVMDIQAQSAQEAVQRAVKTPGVIWPIGSRLKPDQPQPAAANGG